tara:strand:- start:1483 stop:1983 length:501 start_codon:yes stop_codon:yes gene_type:complete
MKNLNIISFFTLFLSIAFSHTAYSNSTPGAKKILFEITDRYNEVKLGITESTVYMIFSEQVRDIANRNFISLHNIDSHTFLDSDGNFITGNVNYLESNKIEFNKSEISEINFNNGKLNFGYKSNPKIGFEDIYSYNGTKVIENFYIEDVEEFILTFSTIFKDNFSH